MLAMSQLGRYRRKSYFASLNANLKSRRRQVQFGHEQGATFPLGHIAPQRRAGLVFCNLA
jgi:hypothetical protein